jgi:hypothetical protein
MDAFTAAADAKTCPFCEMKDKLEKDSIGFVLGPSYMEDDVRLETDRLGFCRRHYDLLYAEQNRLGLSLIVYTHLKKICAALESQSPNAARGGLLARKAGTVSPLAASMAEFNDGCYLCERVERMFERYIETFFYMCQKSRELVVLLQSSGGLCLSHFSMILTEGPKKLRPAAWNELAAEVLPVQAAAFSELAADLDKFIRKFDYRNKNEPLGSAKDALPRALKKL